MLIFAFLTAAIAGDFPGEHNNPGYRVKGLGSSVVHNNTITDGGHIDVETTGTSTAVATNNTVTNNSTLTVKSGQGCSAFSIGNQAKGNSQIIAEAGVSLERIREMLENL